MNTIAKRLREKMSYVGISANGLEKEAGLKRGAVQNILQGRSLKPSGEILYAISSVLGCSIDDLIAISSHDKKNNIISTTISAITKTRKKNHQFDALLYKDAVCVVVDLLELKNITLNWDHALSFIAEIYHYSKENQLKKIDKNFVNWLANKGWKDNDSEEKKN